jgi:DNA-binding XRE family transcriptional regulator
MLLITFHQAIPPAKSFVIILLGSNSMTFNLKQWRNNIGVTQEKAAELLGVHRVTYTNWENEVNPISKTVIGACANLNTRYSGSGGYHKALINNIDDFKKAYKVYFGHDPQGKHLVSAQWLDIKYKQIDFTPDNPLS